MKHPAAMLQVYDGTPFMKDHPGGADSILIVAGQVQRLGLAVCTTWLEQLTNVYLPAGKPIVCCAATSMWQRCHVHAQLNRFAAHSQDASDEFNAIHSSKAKAQLDDFLLGELTTDGIPPAGTHLKLSHAAFSTSSSQERARQADSDTASKLWLLEVAATSRSHSSSCSVSCRLNACCQCTALQICRSTVDVPCPAGAPPSQAAEARDADGRLVALNPRKRIKFALIEKEVGLALCRDRRCVDVHVGA